MTRCVDCWYCDMCLLQILKLNPAFMPSLLSNDISNSQLTCTTRLTSRCSRPMLSVVSEHPSDSIQSNSSQQEINSNHVDLKLCTSSSTTYPPTTYSSSSRSILKLADHIRTVADFTLHALIFLLATSPCTIHVAFLLHPISSIQRATDRRSTRLPRCFHEQHW